MLLFELIQVALKNRQGLSTIPSKEEWHALYEEGKRHSILGLLLCGIEILPEDQRPSQELVLQWIGIVVQIETQNKMLNNAANQLTRIFRAGSLRSCVLKGQGIAQLYKEPLRRQSGDIDLWVEGGRDKILEFLKDSFFGTGQIVIHHVDARIIDGVESEIHFMPGFTFNPYNHWRLQKFYHYEAEKQFNNYNKDLGFSYPTNSLNVVYILSHIYIHYLKQGIGLRQIIDYYYVLEGLSEQERIQGVKDIKECGLGKIAGAVMYVLQQVCGSSDDSLLLPPNKRRGEKMLADILKGGNFGHYSEKYSERAQYGFLKYNLVAFKRSLSLFWYYPSEVICIPFWKVWHHAWRLKEDYIK